MPNFTTPVTENIEGISGEDQTILQEMMDGDAINKEAADIAIHKMLEDEARQGRSGEQADDSEEKPDASADAQEKTDENKNKQEETDSQRRRRLRRESAERSFRQVAELNQEVGKLKERLARYEQMAPDPSNYPEDRLADYTADRAGYAARYVMASEELDEKTAQIESLMQARKAQEQEEIEAFIHDGISQYPDFFQVVSAPDVPIDEDMRKILITGGMRELAYELGKNKLEAARIAALPTQIEKSIELTRMQAARSAKAAERSISKAPPPVVPVRAAGASTSLTAARSMQEYAAKRLPQIRR